MLVAEEGGLFIINSLFDTKSTKDPNCVDPVQVKFQQNGMCTQRRKISLGIHPV